MFTSAGFNFTMNNELFSAVKFIKFVETIRYN